MHAFDVLGDAVRRRILELLAGGEMTSGAVCAVIREEFGISQPAVSQHLRVLRDSGADACLERFRHNRTQHLEAGDLRAIDRTTAAYVSRG